ncbi:MAG: YbaN family protein [Planctomycetes bacterium]|nr:YbaN family protein [Planctomycetota bacterium]
MSPDHAPLRGPARWLLFAAGLACVALAALGAFLPVLPTTPFLLVAAMCFVRTSPSLHRKLLANRVFGPYLAQWQHDHTIPRAAKRKAYGLVVASFALSIALVHASWLRWTLAGLGAALLVFLRCLPTTPRAK